MVLAPLQHQKTDRHGSVLQQPDLAEGDARRVILGDGEGRGTEQRCIGRVGRLGQPDDRVLVADVGLPDGELRHRAVYSAAFCVVTPKRRTM